jgi:hypothetical protein
MRLLDGRQILAGRAELHIGHNPDLQRIRANSMSRTDHHHSGGKNCNRRDPSTVLGGDESLDGLSESQPGALSDADQSSLPPPLLLTVKVDEGRLVPPSKILKARLSGSTRSEDGGGGAATWITNELVVCSRRSGGSMTLMNRVYVTCALHVPCRA